MSDIKFVNILELDERIRQQVREWRNSAGVRQFMLKQHIISAEEHARWIEGLKRDGAAIFWVVFSGDNPIGAAYLHNMDSRNKTSEWGFYIGDDAYRGKGLGKGILSRLLEESFDKIGLERLSTRVFADNAIALKLYRRFGFTEKDKVSFEGGREVISMELSKSAWAKAKEKRSNEQYRKSR